MKQMAGTAKFYNPKTNKYREFSRSFLTDKRWQKITGFVPVKEVEKVAPIPIECQNHDEVLSQLIQEATNEAHKPKRGRKPKTENPQ